VGYDEGGQLTEAVRRKPYSVVLLDEIEKAHPDVFNILLQILEEGRLTDAQGRKVNFKNAIIIMTSNIGARDIVKTSGLGFVPSAGAGGLGHAVVKERVTGELKKAFKPEFLNRVDEVIVFQDLSSDEIEQIVDVMVDRLRGQLMLQGFGISLSPEARKMLAAEGFDPTLGARPLRRAIQRELEDPLSEQILAGNWLPGDTIEVVLEDGRPAFHKGTGEVAVPSRLSVSKDDAPLKPSMPKRGGSSRGGKASGGAAGE
jgi:ATP-dependent Clp protease ATP-binding subunit ClpC